VLTDVKSKFLVIFASFRASASERKGERGERGEDAGILFTDSY
jgi:hypothetical protein